jgi:diguanylate cyclase (GGDEF)-like protein
MAGIRRSSRHRGAAGTVGRVKAAFRNPLGLLTPDQRERFLAIQLENSRPAYSGVLLSGALLLLVLAGLEAMGWTPGIGYPPAVTAAGAIVLAAWALATPYIRNDLLLGGSMLAYAGAFAALLSLPPGEQTSALAFRTGMFNLFPLTVLALTVRRSAVAVIIVFVLTISAVRIVAQGDPGSGAAMYWLVTAVSIVFGLLLRRFRLNFAVYSFLARNELRQQAWTDGLSGLLNRHGWRLASVKLMQRARHNGDPVCAVFFDVDHFKQVNDTHGHDTGDAILRKLASTIRTRLPAQGIAARLGGEEFVVLLAGTDLGAAAQFAEQVRVAFATAARDHGVRVSAGVAQQRQGESLAHLMRRADQSLYSAKQAGRDRVVLAVPADRAGPFARGA